MLGVLFIVWGLLARLPGLMIPGGILTGLGSGILLSQYAFGSTTGDVQGGIIVLGLGVGFLADYAVDLDYLAGKTLVGSHSWRHPVGHRHSAASRRSRSQCAGCAGQALAVVPIIVGIFLIWQLFRRREQ